MHREYLFNIKQILPNLQIQKLICHLHVHTPVYKYTMLQVIFTAM